MVKGEGMYDEQEYAAENPVVYDDLGGGEVTQMLTAASKQLERLHQSIAELSHRISGVRSQSDNVPSTKDVLSEAKMPVSSPLGRLISKLTDEIERATTAVQRIREDIVL